MKQSILTSTGLLKTYDGPLFSQGSGYNNQSFVQTKSGRTVEITAEDVEEYRRVRDRTLARYVKTGLPLGGFFSNGIQVMIATEWLLKVLAR